MCVIALTKPGVMLSADHLRAMWHHNQDGAGMAWIAKDGEVQLRKGFMNENSFIKGYQDNILDSRAHERGPVLLHSRIATLGKVCMDNCHPFRIKGGVMAHNGTLWHGSYGDSSLAEKSDTREYAERMHNNLSYEEVDFASVELGKVLRSHNKLVMLYTDGKYVIINEKEGTWKDDVWYSNLHWLSSFIRITGQKEQDARRAKETAGRRYENT